MSSKYERKMKELADRLAAMSPDAPPFPEETTMTTPARQPGSLRPLTVFAGATLIVLLGLGIPLILMNGGEPPVGSDTTTTTVLPETTTTGETTTTTEGPDTTVTTDPGAAFGAVAYLYQSPENSFRGNPALVPFDTLVEVEAGADEVTVLKATLNLLGNPGFVAPEGFMNGVPAGVEALNVRRADGTDNALIIDMNEAFLEGAGGLLADFTMLNQLIYTATQLEGIEEVQFIVNNQQVTEFGSDGLDLSSSVNRETFQENLALIYVTEPIMLSGDGPVLVAGTSNTFEASMALRVLDADGETVHEEVGQATSGSGTWGEYEFLVDATHFSEGSQVMLFEYSAEDGDPANIITVPVLIDQVWDFLPQS